MKPITDDTIKKIEKIFKFPLYDWQKVYLKGDDWRIPYIGPGSGRTFAYCLKLLLDPKQEPFKISDFKTIERLTDESFGLTYNKIFQRTLSDLADKLLASGFEINAKDKLNFTFSVINGELPKVTIRGERLAVKTCVYSWTTATDKHAGIETVVVTGYINGELTARTFILDFKTGEIFEDCKDLLLY